MARNRFSISPAKRKENLTLVRHIRSFNVHNLNLSDPRHARPLPRTPPCHARLPAMHAPPHRGQTDTCIGGSRGGVRDARPPPGHPNSFDFMQFSGKFGVFTPPLEGSRPPLGKILDQPLTCENKTFANVVCGR